MGALVSAIAIHAQNDSDWTQRLHGTWEGTVQGQRYVETWTCADGTCEGRAITYRGDAVTMTEIARITSFAGQWIYLVAPGDHPVTCFVRAGEQGDSWIFENKEHDFPQRIGYTLTGDELQAWIAGPGKDGDRRFDFKLRRVK